MRRSSVRTRSRRFILAAIAGEREAGSSGPKAPPSAGIQERIKAALSELSTGGLKQRSCPSNETIRPTRPVAGRCSAPSGRETDHSAPGKFSALYSKGCTNHFARWYVHLVIMVIPHESALRNANSCRRARSGKTSCDSSTRMFRNWLFATAPCQQGPHVALGQ